MNTVMKDIPDSFTETQNLADAYAEAHSAFWHATDKICSYAEGTEEYTNARKDADSWYERMNALEEQILKTAEAEGFLDVTKQNAGTAKRLKVFMDRYGYRDAGGWWIKKGNTDNRPAAMRDTGTIISGKQDPEDNR